MLKNHLRQKEVSENYLKQTDVLENYLKQTDILENNLRNVLKLPPTDMSIGKFSYKEVLEN